MQEPEVRDVGGDGGQPEVTLQPWGERLRTLRSEWELGQAQIAALQEWVQGPFYAFRDSPAEPPKRVVGKLKRLLRK